MRLPVLLFALVAACAEAPAPAEGPDFEPRRIALGLGGEGLTTGEAMTVMQQHDVERFLQRIGSRKLSREAILDQALRIEDAFARLRTKGVGTFHLLAGSARAHAHDLAVAAEGGDREAIEDAAHGLIKMCIQCHVRYRPDD